MKAISYGLTMSITAPPLSKVNTRGCCEVITGVMRICLKFYGSLKKFFLQPGYSPRSRRNLFQYSSRLLISLSKPRSGGL